MEQPPNGPELLRAISDDKVLHALLAAQPCSRADLASVTGLSKPTVSQSISRLFEAGLVHEVGTRGGARGRAGTTLAMRHDAGVGLAVHAGPGGVQAVLVGPDGMARAHAEREVAVPESSERLALGLREVAAEAVDGSAPVLAVTVSVADPVDQRSGRTVHLPESPFLVGELDAREALARLRPATFTIDNDVNWALRAERDAGCLRGAENACYFYLDEGMGAGVLAGGRVIRGSRGLAGEIAYLAPGVRGPGNLLNRLRGLGVLRGAAVDLAAMTTALSSAARTEIVDEAAGLVRNVSVLLDPELIVLAGSWGRLIVDDLVHRLDGDVGVSAPIRPAMIGRDAALTGAVQAAARDLVRVLLERVRAT